MLGRGIVTRKEPFNLLQRDAMIQDIRNPSKNDNEVVGGGEYEVPVKEAGIRTDPPMSVPKPSGEARAAISADSPTEGAPL